MIHQYAMGTEVTSLRAIDEGASESSRRLRDQEVKDLADEAFRGATKILDGHRDKLDELAALLLTNEILERRDIDRIMSEVPRAAPPRIGQLSVAAATAVKPAGRPGQH
jgi:cell division protease FtsH